MALSHLGTGIFWYWNATPSPAGIRRQIQAIADAGFACAYLHPLPDRFHKRNFFVGMKCAYLGRRYFDLVQIALEECKAAGIALMLYDEGGWPSGSVLDTLVRRHPECRGRYLVKGPRGGVSMERADFPDLLSPATTRHFIEMTHERYYRRFGGEFGKTIRGIFTDEPFFRCVPDEDMVYYSPGMDALARKMFQCDFSADLLPFLWKGMEKQPGAAEARRKYMAIASRLFAENYFAILEQWCQKHQITLEGHVDHDDSFFRNGDCGDLLEQFSHIHVPGVDAIWRQVFPGSATGHYARFASSASMACHRRQALCECFNVYGYGLTPPVVSWVANALLIQGINRIIPMPFLYSDRGMHKICCSTDFSPRIPMWECFRELNRQWNLASRFDLAALEAPVWVLARCEFPIPDSLWNPSPERIEAESKMEKLLDELDAQGVFWRFCNLEELRKTRNPPEYLFATGSMDGWEKAILDRLEKRGTKVRLKWDSSVSTLSAVRPLGKRNSCLLRPCMRTEGEALMVFNPGVKREDFRFLSRENWGELPLDEAVSVFSPLQRDSGEYRLELDPGELRILLKGRETPGRPRWKERRLTLKWEPIRIERMSFSANGPSRIRPIRFNPNHLKEGFWKQPDFSGILTLVAILECERDIEGFLRFDRICHAGRLYVNGRSADWRVNGPWLFLVKLDKGENRLELRITSSAGNEWRRCLREELEPRNWVNVYLPRLKAYPADDGEIGVSPEATLFF